jgi:hypothetical protein
MIVGLRATGYSASFDCAASSGNVISYLWTCDACGYGFVTKHALRRFACN